ncbi:hypothetical protein EYC84_002885 [Monilinia fructicola]|uniref:Major facilitator superfamily (MFS) profile domain-containing protein n=1 Tax=Monilinia fructicola TaxID=38448 RepID=A0A5M9JVW7_MONFR|nr:hypothetical protein EYC84_002885 [Monilinia fructicola]
MNIIEALNYLYKFTAPRTRPIYNAILGISFGIGKILGPVIGEAFANTPAIGWRWSFYINLPLTGIMAPLFLFLLPKHNPMPSISTLQKLKLIDFLGFILNTLVWASFLVAITMGGSNWVWSSVSSMAVWTLFGTSLLLYIIQQSFCFFTSPNHRIFPVHFLRSQALMLLFVATAATMAAFVIPIFYIPLPYRFAHEFSPMNSANYLIPFISAYFLVILSAGVMLLKIGYYKAIYLLASTFMISGGTLMTHVTINTSSKMVCLYSILISIGVGMSFQTAYDVGMSKVSREAQIPAASDVGMIKELVADEQKFIAYINVAQAGCAGIAPGIAGCVYQNLGVFKLQKVFGDELPVEVMRGALGGLKEGGSESLGSVGEEIMGRALDVVVETMASVYWLVVAAGVAIAICGMGMKWERILLEPEVERNRRRSVNYEAIVY